MAYCAYCGNQISELAPTCPKCGRPNEMPPAAIGTAESVPVAEYASFGRRFVALVIDSLLLVLVGLILPDSRYSSGVAPTELYVRASLTSADAIVTFVYRWLMIALVNGQTVGKMLMGIRIARPDGAPVDLGRAAARAAMGIVSGLAIGLGYLWAAWDPERRTWHDSVADTRAFKV